MRKAKIYVHDIEAGILEELPDGQYQFVYHTDYSGAPISLTIPIDKKIYVFEKFPVFFEGVLPEGMMLDALLRNYKLDKKDYFGQLIQVGHDLVGAVTVKELS
ncbi:MAG: toxin HipA [Gammaproteobacteria bacterium RIFCSPHIGHO2_12_FULL_38_11]|nr:MAG: toxin HipA [Gammaproteobacteria bacterium RIFCSPHIGHO2_12_FULL_38_11]